MAYSRDLVEIAYSHLQRVNDITGVLFCCVIYGKWMDFKTELDYIAACEKKIRSILDEKKKGD